MSTFYSQLQKKVCRIEGFGLLALFILSFSGAFFFSSGEANAACTVSSWTPYATTVCSGTSFTQTSNCGTTRTVNGTKIGTWSPAPSTVCSGTSYTQTSTCGLTQTSTGTGCCDTSWTPYTTTVCSGTPFTQTSNCGRTRTVNGTMIGSWSPAPSTVCSGTSYTQTSTCGLTQTNTGTMCCDTTWGPGTGTVCSGTSFTQTSNCGNTRSSTGTKCCDTSWTPPTSGTCSGTSFTQTSNCGNTRSSTGTKCCDTSWTPAPSGTCSDATFTQTSNCGTTRTVTGTADCSVAGSCGTAATTYSYNATGYSGTACSSGSGSLPSFPAAGSSISWVCYGVHGGTSVGCTATRNPAPVAGSCGTAATTYAYNATSYSGTACSAGTGTLPAFPSVGSNMSWVCYGTNGGTSVGCTATRNLAPINGTCGTKAITYPADAIDYVSGNYCYPGGIAGTPPAFPAPGSSSSWTCNGSNGGTNTATNACVATHTAYACGGTVPTNGTAYTGTNLSGLSSATNYGYANPNTVAKCEFSCNSGYSWNGSACVANPTVNLYATTPIAYNGSTVLTWDTTGVPDNTSCTASGGTWSGTKIKSNLTIGNTVSGIIANTTYILTCRNSANITASASVTVTVVPNPTVTLTAASNSVVTGTSPTLTWTSTDTVAPCISEGGSGTWPRTDRGKTNTSGVIPGAITSATTYTLKCQNSIGVWATGSVTVTVLNIAQPPIITDLSGNGSPLTVGVGQSVGFKVYSAADPGGDNVHYQFDWNNDGTIDGNLPSATTYVAGATIKETAHTWSASGSYIFKVRTQDNNTTAPAVSDWVSFTVNVSALAVCPATATVGVGETGKQVVAWYGVGATCASHVGATDVTMSSGWTSSASTIATVTNTSSDKGWVVGKNVGSATVTGTYLGLSGTVAVKTVINGKASPTVKDTCIRGNFRDLPDTSTSYLWLCTGSGG